MAHKELRREAETHHKHKLHRIAGGHVDADKKSDERMIRSAIEQHEKHDHGGEKATKLKFKRGGHVEDGDAPKQRMDRPGRARGGKAPHKGAHVNVIVAPQVHPGGPGMNSALPVPAAAAPMMPPHPPMPMPMPGGAPGGVAGGPPIGAMAPRIPVAPGAAPMMPPRKRGGKVSYPIEDGAGGGKGRLEKAKSYGDNSDDGEGRRRGGRA